MRLSDMIVEEHIQSEVTMKRKYLFAILLILLSLTAFNGYTTIKYNQSLVSLLFRQNDLTEEEIQYLKEKKTLFYGADYNAPPLRSVNPHTDQYEGIVIDYLNALSLELSTNIDKKPMVWADALEALKNGAIDFCDMHPSEERSAYFDFTEPIYHQRGGILISNAKRGIDSPKDIENKTIAAIKDDYVIEYVNTTFEKVHIQTHVDLEKAIQALEKGEVDAVLGDESVIRQFVVKQGLTDRYRLLDTFLYEREAVLGVRKGDTVLLNILNKGISKLGAKDTMTQIMSKWSPLITKSHEDLYMKTVLIYTAIALILIVSLFYLWNAELKKEVKRQTYALRQSKQILETTFNGLSNHLLLLVDQQCSVLEANDAFCAFIKFDHNDVLGKHCYEIPGIIGMNCQNCMIQNTFNTQSSTQMEIQYQNKIFNAQSYYLESKGVSPAVLILFEDITELKTTQRQLLQSGKMAALGQLSAGIAHEIRTPLGIIRNSSYLLKKVSDNPKAKESIETIEKATTRANGIIDNLLNFSRISDYHCKPIVLYDFIDDLVKLHLKTFEQRKIAFNLEIDPTLNAVLPLEPLKHILINLITNALDAVQDQGHITLRVIEHTVNLEFEVRDNGEGIDEAHQSLIFDPFFTTKPQGKGTGLGLYIVYNEIDKLGGTISVTSKKHQGTTFTVTLPKGEHV